MHFVVVPRSQSLPQTGNDVAYLRIDHWNDFSFVTMFDVRLFDGNGSALDLGQVKIGFAGQDTQTDTYSTLDGGFEQLPDGYFSVGQDESYYRILVDGTPPALRTAYLRGLNDVVADTSHLTRATGQEVFRVSLLRSVSVSTIEGQFRRILSGGASLSDFDFEFVRPQSEAVAGITLHFVVEESSKPSTNIHALIGRNGVGKTTLLNQMTTAIVRPTETEARFYVNSGFERTAIDSRYFSSVISVAFSAFDPFNPPTEQSDPERGTRYFYIGLKDIADDSGTLLKSLSTLRDECVASMGECFADSGKLRRWRGAIATLESDENFAQMNLDSLSTLAEGQFRPAAVELVRRMSSGHAIVLLTISRLVAKVEEKTLVLLDEPESHLHPPLLSAFTRALSELLYNRNGVAIVATHSPVVLQEVPRSCVSVINRSRLAMVAEPPRVETFGENVGVLTREVFGLEVAKSGFHALLAAEASEGKSYDEIMDDYQAQLGLEARGMLRAMVGQQGEGEAN